MSSLKHEELLLPLIESSSDPQHPHISLDANCEVKQEFFCENILALMLHALLLVDFGIFFYREDPSVENLEWKLVSFSIVLYMITTHLYRACLSDFGVSNDFALLLPEITIVASMCVALFQHVIAAFLLLVLAKFIMALCVIFISTHKICKISSSGEVIGHNEKELIV